MPAIARTTLVLLANVAVACIASPACQRQSDTTGPSPKATTALIATYARQVVNANRVFRANDGDYTSDLDALRKTGLLASPARLKEVSSWEVTTDNTVVVHLNKGAEPICNYANKELAEVLSCSDLTLRFTME